MAFTVEPWLAVLASGAFGQLIKLGLYSVVNRHFDVRVLATTNGLPSLYAIVFGCLTTICALELGVRSPAFTLCFILSGIILHDSIRFRGSVDRGGRASRLIAEAMADQGDSGWLDEVRPLLGDRRHRPLHVFVGLAMGVLGGLAWMPLFGGGS